VDRLRGLVREAGRDPAAFGIEGRVALSQLPPEERAKEWDSVFRTPMNT
jgi:hypothetical protein